MKTQKQLIEKIKKIRFGIGLDTNNIDEELKLAIDDKKKILQDASKLAEEIHTKNPHFILELIQNAEDNEYLKDPPKIRFIINHNFLLIQNNEKGFEEKNVWALCGIGGSTKKNEKSKGYIGEKGIGFKSVFMIANKVQIFSNGFQFEFNYKETEPETMIIPDWIDKVPDFIDSNQTNIILYFKPEEKDKIKNYFEEIHLSLLLFLNKLKIIEIESDNYKRKIEKNEKNGIVEVIDNGIKSYWRLIRKKINVEPHIKEEKRKDIKETEIILAFPLNENGFSNTSEEQYLFAFLPVRKYGFRFIIQADFILPVTREDIVKDNKWNEWLRNSLIDLFIEAVDEFKNDDKLKYSFYDYLFMDEVKDEFFLVLKEQIFEKLKDKECILTEGNRWRKPSEVLIGDNEIKRIILNEDLQLFFKKEYLSEEIKSKKSVFNKLGINEFSIDDIIDCLENSEWIKKHDSKWFVHLFGYLSKKNLSEEQLKRIKNLSIIKLENGELTSINEGTVFFPLKNKIYNFEDELRVINREIIKMISKEKNEKDNILIFLKKLGLKQAAPYEIIENHILPVYESGSWNQKDSRILYDYVRYIKDNIEKYERESDKRLNTNKSSWESKEDPLKHLKETLFIRVYNNNEEKYENPKNIYLSKVYGNENNLEELFEGIDVNFIHSCYIKEEIKQIENKISDLKNKLKKIKKRKLKKLEKYIKKLEEEKDRKIYEWKEFFLKIGVWETIMVEIDPETIILDGPKYAKKRVTNKQIYKSEKKDTIWKNEKWENTDRKYYIENDWISPHLEQLLEKLNKDLFNKRIEKSKQLLKMLDKYWDKNYSENINTKYYYRLYGQQGWSEDFTKSTFLLLLINNAWLPTNKNTLSKPSEIFLNKNEIKEVLGETVSYLAIEIKNENFIRALGINTEANVEGVLNYLKSLVEQKNNDKEKFEKLYQFLDDYFEKDRIKIKENFIKNSLIFIPNSEKKYYNSKQVIWSDVSKIFGNKRVYLEKYYKNLKEFFVKKLEISEKPTPKDYAGVLEDISKNNNISDDDKKVIIKIYEELNRHLNPKNDENISNENWWKEFIQKSIFFTNQNRFCKNEKNIFINDNSELYEFFKDEKQIAFLYLPERYNPDKIKFFIDACKLRYLSKSVKTQPLLEETMKYPKDEKFTQLIRTVTPYVLQYLYWKENQVYEELKKKGMFEEIGAIEIYNGNNLKVKYSIEYDYMETIEKEAERNCMYYNGKLYKKKDASIYELAVEFSKIFGENKGIDDFIMNIMNNPQNAKEILKVKNISNLPKEEMEFWEKVINSNNKQENTGDLRKNQEHIEILKKNGDDILKNGHHEIPQKESFSHEPKSIEIPIETENINEDGKEVFVKDWESERKPIETIININDYIINDSKIEKKTINQNNKTSFTHSQSLKTSTEVLNEKSKKDIGKWGEEYALYSIIKEKLECFNIKITNNITFKDILDKYSAIIKETENGYVLCKNGRNIEIIWFNKNGESGEHYDIKIEENKEEIFIEVKSTKDNKKNYFTVSKEQWKIMKEKGNKFYIYRVYGAGTNEAKLIKIQNPAKLWEEGKIEAYPVGIEL